MSPHVEIIHNSQLKINYQPLKYTETVKESIFGSNYLQKITFVSFHQRNGMSMNVTAFEKRVKEKCGLRLSLWGKYYTKWFIEVHISVSHIKRGFDLQRN